MEAIARQIQPLISTPIFSWGKTEISLYTLFSIAFVILLISVTANFLSRLLKRSLALTLKLDRGTLEAIALIFNYLILSLVILSKLNIS